MIDTIILIVVALVIFFIIYNIIKGLMKVALVTFAIALAITIAISGFVYIDIQNLKEEDSFYVAYSKDFKSLDLAFKVGNETIDPLNCDEIKALERKINDSGDLSNNLSSILIVSDYDNIDFSDELSFSGYDLSSDEIKVIVNSNDPLSFVNLLLTDKGYEEISTDFDKCLFKFTLTKNNFENQTIKDFLNGDVRLYPERTSFKILRYLPFDSYRKSVINVAKVASGVSDFGGLQINLSKISHISDLIKMGSNLSLNLGEE